MTDIFNQLIPDSDVKTQAPVVSDDIFNKLIPDASEVTQDVPIPDVVPMEPPSGIGEAVKPAIEKTKEYGKLAKDPMGVIAGGMEFFSAIPGFLTGLVGASQNVIKGVLGGQMDMDELYEFAAEGFQREAEKIPPADFKGHPQSHLVGETFMAPALAIMYGGHELADKIDDPDARGSLKFASDIIALATQGKIMHRGKGKGVELPEKAPKLDTEYAKKLIKDRIAEERAKGQPLDKLVRHEETLRSDRLDTEMERVFTEVPESKDVIRRIKKEHEGPPVDIEPQKVPEEVAFPDVDYALRQATERVGGEYGVREGVPVEVPRAGEFGEKIQGRTEILEALKKPEEADAL